MYVVRQYASVSLFVYAVTLIHSRQALLVVVLLITIGINVMFIMDTNRRLHEESSTTGRPTYRLTLNPLTWKIW
jgi:hypothetical protein